MFQAKESVLDRIEQSFGVLMKNPIALIVPLAVLQIIMIVLLPQIGLSLIMGGNFIDMSSPTSLLYMVMSIGMIYLLFYIIVMTPITIGIMKGVVDLIQGKDIKAGEIIIYGFQKLTNVFTVYWYMFAYIYLIPAICFIIAGFIMLFGLFLGNEIFSSIGGVLMFCSTIYAFIQGAYKGMKGCFGLSSALYEENFTKEQFMKSVSFTDGKWWRILGNFILVGIIGSLASSLISGLLNSISFLGTDTSDMLSMLEPKAQDFQGMLEEMTGDMGAISISTLIAQSISSILSSVISVFTIIFSIIFYLRLKQEAGDRDTVVINKENTKVINEL